jgi:hypothetical protein
MLDGIVCKIEEDKTESEIELIERTPPCAGRPH